LRVFKVCEEHRVETSCYEDDILPAAVTPNGQATFATRRIGSVSVSVVDTWLRPKSDSQATGPLGNEVRASDLRALVVAARSDHGNREVKHLQSSRVSIAVQQECVCVCVCVCMRQISCGINS